MSLGNYSEDLLQEFLRKFPPGIPLGISRIPPGIFSRNFSRDLVQELFQGFPPGIVPVISSRHSSRDFVEEYLLQLFWRCAPSSNSTEIPPRFFPGILKIFFQSSSRSFSENSYRFPSGNTPDFVRQIFQNQGVSLAIFPKILWRSTGNFSAVLSALPSDIFFRFSSGFLQWFLGSFSEIFSRVSQWFFQSSSTSFSEKYFMFHPGNTPEFLLQIFQSWSGSSSSNFFWRCSSGKSEIFQHFFMKSLELHRKFLRSSARNYQANFTFFCDKISKFENDFSNSDI